MAFEKGGIADKQGNVYENRFLAKKLISLIAEEITSVVVEPAGTVVSICEFYTKDKNGKKIYYQCKGSNGDKDHWAPSDLDRYNLFSRVKKLLESDSNCEFCFVSPLYYSGLNDLCERAKEYSSGTEFHEYALTNSQLRNTFAACERYLNLNHNDLKQLDELKNILSRCEFLVVPNNSETVHDLEGFINVYFCGIAGDTRLLLENYVNDTASYRKELIASDIINYLLRKGVQLRAAFDAGHIRPVIERLNNSFSESFNAIQGSLFHRGISDEIIDKIKDGHSVIIHGKAGVGKSGCVRELIRHLEEKQVCYLAISLDKHMPSEYADKYGKMLGLPESPVNSLFHISGTRQCVLILDQLDALRWTALHSATALDVCKEMLAQAQFINNNAGGSISIVFSVRTFDYENDAGIKSLFKMDNQAHPWSEIEINVLSDGEVMQIVGDNYNNLSSKVKNLIRVPASLFVWTQLDSKRKMNQLSSALDLVKSWWGQIRDSYSEKGLDVVSLDNCINSLVKDIENAASFTVPQIMYMKYSREVDYLVSGGLLIQDSSLISFAHQTFLDTFLLVKDLEVFFTQKASLLSIILLWKSQMPIYRYRLAALWQNIIDWNQDEFIREAYGFLESEHIHFYFKSVIFEIISQLTVPTSGVMRIVDEYFAKEEWHTFIIQTVYDRHPVFIEHLSTQNILYWFSEEGYPLLETMKYYSPNFVLHILRELMEKHLIEYEKIIRFLGSEISEEDDNFFEIRMEIYKNDINLLSGIRYIDIEKVQPAHLLKVLELVLENVYVVGVNRVYIDGKKMIEFCEKNYIIICSLFDRVCKAAKNLIPSPHTIINYDERFWFPHEPESSFTREIVNLIKISLKILAVNEPEKALGYILQTDKYKNGISNELALATVLELPFEYSDWAIEWLISDFDNHIFDCISNSYDYLQITKEILKKHSLKCSKGHFEHLEHIICNWKGDRERFVSSFKMRLEINRSKDSESVYWPTWGHLQKTLLPFLDSTRTQKKTKELINVLNRNSWVRINDYHEGILCGPAKNVISTIRKNSEHFNDKNWIKIVSADITDIHSRMPEKEDEKYYYESSHRAFAQDFGKCVKKDPVRFAELILKFPLNCPENYYVYALNSLSSIETQRIDFDMICKVIRHVMGISSYAICRAITDIIDVRLEENWPEDIIHYLIQIATGNLNLIDNEGIDYKQDDEHCLSQEDLIMAVRRNPRSIAVETMGKLMIHHLEVCEWFKPYIEALALDESAGVRFATTTCAAAFYEQDHTFAYYLLDILLEKDLCVLYAKHCFLLMRSDLHILVGHYFEYMKKACNNQNPKLTVHVAQLTCITAILTSNKQVLDFLYTYEWTLEAIEKICMKAVEAFEKEEYHVISQSILEHFLEVCPESINYISYLLREKKIDMKRDERFIMTVLQKNNNIDIIYDFLEFIKEQDVDIACFSMIIKQAVESINDKVLAWQQYRIEEGLVNAIIKLVDIANGDDELTEICLDILDEVFRKRILNDSGVSKLLNGVD